MRTFDVEYVNGILNHPRVFKWISKKGQSAIDATDILADIENYAIQKEDGVFLYVHQGGGIYHVHTNFLPNAKDVAKKARESLKFMFMETPCIEVHTQVPVDNRAADVLTKRMGFKLWFTRKDSFERESGKVDTRFYLLTFHDWAKGQSFSSSGKWFHDELERIGVETDHDDDPVHDQYVGLSVELLRNGQIAKAEFFYNRWARLAWYQPVAVLNADPLVIDIHSAVIQFGDKLERV